MSNIKLNQEEIDEINEIIYSDDVKLSIITSLEWYESLNLKKLTQLTGRPKSTVIRHLQDLIEQQIITLDQSKASQRGKYYILDTKIKHYLDAQNEYMEGREDDLSSLINKFKDMEEYEIREAILEDLKKRKELGQLTKLMKGYLSFITNVQNALINDFSILEKKIVKKLSNDTLKPEDLPLSEITMHVSRINIGTYHQIMQVQEYLRDFLVGLRKLKEKFDKEITEQGIAEEKVVNLLTYMFLGGIPESYSVGN